MAEKSSRKQLRGVRRQRKHGCWDHLIIAPLWVAYQENLGTLARTCDAVGACLAVPATEHYDKALARGDTLGPKRQPCIHRVHGDRTAWVEAQTKTSAVVAVELAEGATPLTLLEPARRRTVVLLGHEHEGIPDEVIDLAEQVVEIPMIGAGASLNVAVAGSLVLYRLAGLA